MRRTSRALGVLLGICVGGAAAAGIDGIYVIEGAACDGAGESVLRIAGVTVTRPDRTCTIRGIRPDGQGAYAVALDCAGSGVTSSFEEVWRLRTTGRQTTLVLATRTATGVADPVTYLTCPADSVARQ